MRVIFAGTPDFACPALRALARSGHDVVAVLTQPDRVRGRGRRLHASPVKELAVALELPVYQPETLRDAHFQRSLAALGADLMVVVAYGRILPRAVLDGPVHGCINVHASLLPRWRGAAPIQRAILAGDHESGVTIMQMATGLDTGDILLQARCPLDSSITGGELHDRLAGMGGDALMQAMDQLQAGTLKPRPQDEAAASYAEKLTKSEARMDWQQPAEVLERQVRAFNPWPGSSGVLGGETVRIWSALAHSHSHSDGNPVGGVIHARAEGIEVVTGDGILRIGALQWPGGRVLSAGEAANGHRLQGLVFQ